MKKPAAPPPAAPPEIALPEPKFCKLCTLQLVGVSAHLSKDHCLRELVGRVSFMRQVILAQEKQLQQQGLALIAGQRFAYAILAHFTEGANRAVLSRADFEEIPAGAAITMQETPSGEFEIIGLLPEKEPKQDPGVA